MKVSPQSYLYLVAMSGSVGSGFYCQGPVRAKLYKNYSFENAYFVHTKKMEIGEVHIFKMYSFETLSKS